MDRKELLKNIGDGKFATVTFVKRTTGETRVMNCRTGVKTHTSGHGKSYDDSEKNLVTVYDVHAHGYRTIPCENVLKVRAHGKVVYEAPSEGRQGGAAGGGGKGPGGVR